MAIKSIDAFKEITFRPTEKLVRITFSKIEKFRTYYYACLTPVEVFILVTKFQAIFDKYHFEQLQRAAQSIKCGNMHLGYYYFNLPKEIKKEVNKRINKIEKQK